MVKVWVLPLKEMMTEQGDSLCFSDWDGQDASTVLLTCELRFPRSGPEPRILQWEPTQKE